MRLRALLASTFLLAGLAGTPAVAQTAPTTLEARDSWQSAQVLIRSAMRMEVDTKDGRDTQVFWMFMERTPSGKMRVIIKDDLEGPNRLQMLIQDNRGMVIHGEDVFSPGTPWMLGTYLFDQMMEPAMLLEWSLGIPGKSFSVEPDIAEVVLDRGQVASVKQEGWAVDYLSWKPDQAGSVSLPDRFVIKGDYTTIHVTVDAMEAFEKAPADYSEFKIM